MASPLFPRFNKHRQQQEAVQRFSRTPYGRDVQDLGRRYGGNIPEAELRRLVSRYGKDIESAVARYAKKNLFEKLLDKLGTVGSLVGALIRPRGQPMASPAQELEAAKALLEEFGYTVKPPEKVNEPPAERPEVRVTTQPQEPDELPEQKPLVEGMIPVSSSNVHSIGYEWHKDEGMPGNLLVRFLAGSGKQRSGPGPLYRYRDVPRSVFRAFKEAASKGKFVWDELRVRGTVSGHQYEYELAGTGFDDYIPRQAGLKRGMAGEYYLTRRFAGRQSTKPEKHVRGPKGQLRGYKDPADLKFRAGRRS